MIGAEAWIERHPFVLRLKKFSPDLSSSEIRRLFGSVEDDLQIPSHRDLVIQGYKLAYYYMIENGFAMRYHLLHDGRRQVLSIVIPGDIVGLAETFFEHSPKTVCSLTEMKIQRLHQEKFLEICASAPRLAIAMICYLASQLGLYYERLTEIGRKSPLERTAHFLLRLHSRLRAIGYATENAFEMPLSQEVIGDLLGLSGPHVNRMLHRLRSEGLIATQRRQIELLDLEGLRRLSEFALAA